MLRRSFLALMAALLVSQAEAGHLHAVGDGAVAGGYDVVAFFDGRARRGEARHAVTVDGHLFLFATAANRAAFLADPAQFSPAYDGHCAYGVRMGQKFGADPTAYDVIDGRLFLFLDEGMRNMWRQSADENISIADGIWAMLRDSEVN